MSVVTPQNCLDYIFSYETQEVVETLVVDHQGTAKSVVAMASRRIQASVNESGDQLRESSAVMFSKQTTMEYKYLT